jgi:fibrillarin-like rRNA methylase
MMKFSVKTLHLPFKVMSKNNEALHTDTYITKTNILFFLFLIMSVFFKIYSSNMVVVEAKKVDVAKYKLKIVESELKKIKSELAKISEKDKLLEYSKNLNESEKIDLVVVK